MNVELLSGFCSRKAVHKNLLVDNCCFTIMEETSIEKIDIMAKESVTFDSQKTDKENGKFKQKPSKNNCNGLVQFFHKLRYSKDFRRKFAYSIFLCMPVMSIGWIRGELGPAFLDLQVISGVGLEKGSGILTTYYIGRILGSLIAGPLYDRFNKNLLFTVSISITASSLAIIPWCFLYELMIVTHFINGVSGEIMDVAVNAEAMSLWGRNCRSFIQAVWFAYTGGCILSPIATAPYLIKEIPKIVNASHTSNATYMMSKMEINSLTNSSHLLSSSSGQQSRLYIINSISASIILVSALPFLVLCCRFDSGPASPETPDDDKTMDLNTKRFKDFSFLKKVLVLTISGMFSSLLTGLDYTFSSYLTLFCVKYLHWTKGEGALLTSAYFLTTLAGRMFGTVIAGFISSTKIMTTCTLMCLTAYMVLTITAYHKVSEGIWFSTCYVGLGMSLLYPTFLSWTNIKFMPVTGKVVSYLFVTSFIGPILNPIIITPLLINFTMLWFCYALFVQCILLALIVTLMVCYTIRKKKRTKCPTNASASLTLMTDDKIELNS